MVMDFPAVRALDGVSVSFEPGEVHGIVGENGAGKSTLMRILAGLQLPTSGEIWHGDDSMRLVELHGVRDALKLGIAMIHQELNLVDPLTVAENVWLGREPRSTGLIRKGRMRELTESYLDQVGARFGPDDTVGSLSLAQKQLVEIAKALSQEASILIMDEPTSVLSEQETASLFALIERLKERGVSVAYISHRLAEVEQVCDRVTVLRDGKLIAMLERGMASQSEMAALMVGRELGDMFPAKREVAESPPALRALEVSDGERVFGASLEVRPHEVVGLAGLIGSGRTEFAEILVGVRPLASGRIERQGAPVRIGSAKQAARHRVAYVSEDRKDTGLVLAMDTIENITLANLRSYARPLIDRGSEREAAGQWVRRLDIRVGDLRAPTLYLSGGNQQKVSVAKWLELEPKVLILDEPTRGVDVGAKREMYGLIQELASSGMACIVISSELPELLGLCHRVLVMRHGRIVGELAGDEMTEEAIMVLAAGVEAA